METTPPTPTEPEKDGNKKSSQAFTAAKTLAIAVEFGFIIVIPLLVFIYAGKWLDHRYDTEVFVYVGIVAALAASSLWFYRRIDSLLKDLKNKWQLPPLAAETIFHIGHFPVTNTYINSTLTMVGFVIFAFLINRAVVAYRKKDRAPRGLLNFFEALLETLFKYMDGVTGDRKRSIRFLPIVGTLFFFILVSNWIGLLPGIGSLGIYQLHHGEVELIPLFRSANTDLNMTLSMAVLAVVSSHIIGIITIGFFKYANKFIKLGDIWHAIKSMKPMNVLIAGVEFIVGLIEVFSEVAKMVSLSLRLFGNVFAGEVLLTVLASLIAFVVPLPFMALELLVGLIQAVVFSMLTLVYLSIATTPIAEHGKDSHGAAAQDEHDLQATPTA